MSILSFFVLFTNYYQRVRGRMKKQHQQQQHRNTTSQKSDCISKMSECRMQFFSLSSNQSNGDFSMEFFSFEICQASARLSHKCHFNKPVVAKLRKKRVSIIFLAFDVLKYFFYDVNLTLKMLHSIEKASALQLSIDS